jgi:hypothetical protein
VVVKYNWHLLHWVGYNHSTEHFSEGTWFAEQAANFEKDTNCCAKADSHNRKVKF